MKKHGLPVPLVGVFVLAIAAFQAHAQVHGLAAGSYRCASYNVSGGGGSCRNMPPLLLRADQSYQYSSTQGRWNVQGGTLQLSASGSWGPGQILGHDTIRFEYEYRGWHHTVTWICQACEAPGTPAQASASAAAPPGNHRSVRLTLEFGNSIHGVSGFTIVPLESARSYSHNAPLPKDAVQGLARELGATSVALATNASNKLQGGRQYVVFLAWPRETLPVATFSLPSGSTDYQATLAASLR